MIRTVRSEDGAPELRASIWISAGEAHMLSLAVAALASTFAAQVTHPAPDDPPAAELVTLAAVAGELRQHLDAVGLALVRAEWGEPSTWPAPLKRRWGVRDGGA
jgi:hypothetical protein